MARRRAPTDTIAIHVRNIDARVYARFLRTVQHREGGTHTGGTGFVLTALMEQYIAMDDGPISSDSSATPTIYQSMQLVRAMKPESGRIPCDPQRCRAVVMTLTSCPRCKDHRTVMRYVTRLAREGVLHMGDGKGYRKIAREVCG